MSDYRPYYLDEAGKIAKAEWIEAKSDDEAIVLVRVKKLPFQCELWSGARLVDRVTPQVSTT